MAFLIKYIKDGGFVATEQSAGPLEDATNTARLGIKVHQADVAAVMDAGDLDGAPKAVIMADG